MEALSQTIRQAAFRERLRGYNPDDVDEFLERVALGVELLEERLAQAAERVARAERVVDERGTGGTVAHRTLQLAERTAELAVGEAREEAARVVAAAQREARVVLDEARDEARRLADEAQAELRAEVSRLDMTRKLLGDDVAALERFVAEQRAMAQRSLADAAIRLGELVPDPAAPPELREVTSTGATEAAPVAVPEPAPTDADVDDPFAEVRRSGRADAVVDEAPRAG